MVDKNSYNQIRFLTLHMHFLIQLKQFLILSLHIFLLQHDFLTWSTQLHRAWHGIPYPTALRYTTPCSSDSHVKHGFFRLINHVKLIWRVVGWCQVYCGTMWSRAPAAQGPSLWLHHESTPVAIPEAVWCVLPHVELLCGHPVSWHRRHGNLMVKQPCHRRHLHREIQHDRLQQLCGMCKLPLLAYAEFQRF